MPLGTKRHQVTQAPAGRGNAEKPGARSDQGRRTVVTQIKSHRTAAAQKFE
jgi:hypothetical protein